MSVELPRLVKKPGHYLRVNTLEELDAALADGWVLRLDAASVSEPVAPESVAGELPAELPEPEPEPEPELEESADVIDAGDPAEPAVRKARRRRRSRWP